MTVSYKIEILNIDSKVCSAAFYYDVPANIQLPGAIDASRTQFGTKLNSLDISGLQEGTIYGEVVLRTIAGMTPAQAAAFMQSEWTNYQIQAAANYAEKYTNHQYAGKAFDGSAWS